MAELVGATVMLGPLDLKKLLLLFDRIACKTHHSFEFRESPTDQQYWDDVEALRNWGVVFTPEFEPPAHASSSMRGEATARLDMWQSIADHLQSGGDRSGTEQGRERALASIDAAARAYAVRLRSHDGINAVPLTQTWSSIGDEPLTRTEVIHLVLRELPLPGANHSFRDIMGFRDEARSQGLTQGLRVWMNEMASGELTHLEVSDKLENLVSCYDRALTLEKMS
jgi:hypothetical protein